jgi:acetyl-CoA synthase
MGLFDEEVEGLNACLEKMEVRGIVRKTRCSDCKDWPSSNGSQIILKEDVGVELGNPETASDSILVWTEDLEIEDGVIAIVGPDLSKGKNMHLPFAQILIFKGHFEDEYECYKKLRRLQRDVNLDGYMLRATPQRLWVRVSKEALDRGFSLGNLGRALIDKFKKESYIKAVQVVFVTSSKEVKELGDISNRVKRIVGAMNKMVEELSLDCNTCDYQGVCKESNELRRIRKKLQGASS